MSNNYGIIQIHCTLINSTISHSFFTTSACYTDSNNLIGEFNKHFTVAYTL